MKLQTFTLSSYSPFRLKLFIFLLVIPSLAATTGRRPTDQIWRRQVREGGVKKGDSWDKPPLCLIDKPSYLPPLKASLQSPQPAVLPKPLATTSSELLDESSASNSTRIVGGYDCEQNYQVALFIYGVDGTYFCGGSKIANGSVMTAAHCCDAAANKTNAIDLIFGATRLSQRDDNWRIVRSINIIINSEYDSSSITFDCCIVNYTVTSWTESSSKVGIIKLLVNDLSDVQIATCPQHVTVSGWGVGSTLCPNPHIEDHLQCLDMLLITNVECKLWYVGAITKEHICAEALPGHATCFGDSGSALTLSVNKIPYQVGIVSFGLLQYCELGYPDVFARIYACLEFTKSVCPNLLDNN